MVTERKVGKIVEQAARSEVYFDSSIHLRSDFLGAVVSRQEVADRFSVFEGMPHKDIVDLAQRGNTLALEWIYVYFHDRVCDFAMIKLGNTTAASDLASDIMESVVTKVDQYKSRPDVPFHSWVFTIAHHKLVNHYKRMTMVCSIESDFVESDETSPKHYFLPAIDGPEEEIVRWIQFQEIIADLEKLPDAQRKVMMLRFVGDNNVAETAALLGKNEGTVKVLQHKAVSRLREINCGGPVD